LANRLSAAKVAVVLVEVARRIWFRFRHLGSVLRLGASRKSKGLAAGCSDDATPGPKPPRQLVAGESADFPRCHLSGMTVTMGS
jgi:hypothetical protein